MATYGKGNLYQISIEDFKLDPTQPRKVVDLDALAVLTHRLQNSAFSSRYSFA